MKRKSQSLFQEFIYAWYKRHHEFFILRKSCPVIRIALGDRLTGAYKLWHIFFKNLPRLSRFTIGTRIDTIFLDLIELVLLAGYTTREQKLGIVQKASGKLDSLKFFLKIAWDVRAIDHKKYAALSTPLVEVGRMLGGWLK